MPDTASILIGADICPIERNRPCFKQVLERWSDGTESCSSKERKRWRNVVMGSWSSGVLERWGVGTESWRDRIMQLHRKEAMTECGDGELE